MLKHFVLAASAAALVLAGCTKVETVEIADQNLISFGDSFIGNPTKAVEEVTTTTIDHFYVYGHYGTNSSYTDNVFNNQYVSNATGEWTYSPLQPWEDEQDYIFAAYYVEGGESSPVTPTVTETTKGLTFTNYTIDKNYTYGDLLYDDNVTSNGSKDRAKVKFTFDHMLSWITFELKSGFAEGVILGLSNVEFYGMNSKATLTDGTWGAPTDQLTTGSGLQSNTTDIITGIKSAIAPESAVDGQLDWFVIPQSIADASTVYLKFTVTLSGNGLESISNKSFEVTAAIPAIEWEKGNHYTYTTTITGYDEYITFDAPTVTETWTEKGANLDL